MPTESNTNMTGKKREGRGSRVPSSVWVSASLPGLLLSHCCWLLHTGHTWPLPGSWAGELRNGCLRSGLVFSWGSGLLGLLPVPAGWHHIAEPAYSFTSQILLNNFYAPRTVFRHWRYEGAKIKALTLMELTLWWGKWISAPSCPLSWATLCGAYPAPLFMMNLSILSLFLYQKKSQRKGKIVNKHIFFFWNKPTDHFQVSYSIRQGTEHLSLPLGHSICSLLPQEEHFRPPAWAMLLITNSSCSLYSH